MEESSRSKRSGMKCQLVQGVWASTPPRHEVTAMLATEHPPCVWTGSLDGAIIRWDIAQEEKEMQPMALLCGHSSAITSLESCTPSKESKIAGKPDSACSHAENLSLANANCCFQSPVAVLSASLDRVLCVWESLTGRCQRRRRLPPWVGSPSVIVSIPASEHYVCIACHVDCLLSATASSADTLEATSSGDLRSDSLASRLGGKGTWRGGILILDTAGLSVLQVVYHGDFRIGPIRSMAVTCNELNNELEYTVSVADAFGRSRVWSHIRIQSCRKEETNGPVNIQDNLSGMPSVQNGSIQNIPQSVCLSSNGKFLLKVLKGSWELSLVVDGSILATSSIEALANSKECLSNCKTKDNLSYFVSGCFLDRTSDTHSLQGNLEAVQVVAFAVSSSEGETYLYSMNTSNSKMAIEFLLKVPAVTAKAGDCIALKCCMLGDMLVRCEWRFSVVYGASLPMQLTLWSVDSKMLPDSDVFDLNSCHLRFPISKGPLFEEKGDSDCQRSKEQSKKAMPKKLASLKGSGSLNGAWLKFRSTANTTNVSKLGSEAEVATSAEKETENGLIRESDTIPFCERVCGYRDLLSDTNKLVTSTLLILPGLLVYGFNTGEILLVKLEGHLVSMDNKCHEGARNGPLRQLLWHTGAIQCLAEHSMRVSNSATEMLQVLLSGSVDCCVCLWDLREENCLITVYRHHVAPIRQLLLPPHGTKAPWFFCFISIGDDGCVAISSLETLRVERMFPGHPGAPKSVAWDGVRGYVACLCTNPISHVAAGNILYIWDIHSGAQERILRGTAAHSMYTFFCGRIKSDLAANKIYPSTTPFTSSFLTNLADYSFQSSVVEAEKLWGQSWQVEVEYTEDRAALSAYSTPSMNSLPDTNTPNGSILLLPDSTSQNKMGNFERFSLKVAQAFSQGSKAGPSRLVQDSHESDEKLSSLTASHYSLDQAQQPIKGSSPFPGIAALQFDTALLIDLDFQKVIPSGNKYEARHREIRAPLHGEAGKPYKNQSPTSFYDKVDDKAKENIMDADTHELLNSRAMRDSETYPQMTDFLEMVEGRFLRQSLSFLHFWGVDLGLDSLLEQELHICQPKHLLLGVGLAGDRGASTLMLPHDSATLKLWSSSPEFCSMRSLTMVSLAQYLLFSSTSSSAYRALAAFYCRGLADWSSGSIIPSLELYACFWQDPTEHVRLAARSLFHCAASRAVPPFLRALSNLGDARKQEDLHDGHNMKQITSRNEQVTGHVSSSGRYSVDFTEWIESADSEGWISMVGGSHQDARAARIIVSAALAVWYPSLVHSDLAPAVAPLLMKVVRAAIDRHSATAAELLAEGMATTWKALIYHEIPDLVADVFSIIECLNGKGGSNVPLDPAIKEMIQESLIGKLLPSLAASHISGFLSVVQNQLKSVVPGSPVHLIALTTVIRMMRDVTRAVLPHLCQVSAFILQTMDPANAILRKQCLHTAMTAIQEMARLFPMVALYQGFVVSNAKLAVADAFGDLRSLAIYVYDLYSTAKLKVLDASGPPGYLTLISRNRSAAAMGGISALGFSPDGEGLVVFSQQGLTIRWWSLGAVWWEKLSRTLVPVQCTKMILVPPSAGFSPKSSKTSIITTLENHHHANHHHAAQENGKGTTTHELAMERPNFETMDLSYRLEWRYGRTVALLRHGEELFSVQL